ncbi:MAG: UDP-glucose 4-epimerase, partial [Caulobacteraceae bacterium]|nr:UDP-glucose 4-epimerase [Caulobacteraceae bacterium]
VYGAPLGLKPLQPLGEDLPKAPSSPYGESKLIGEQMIAAHCRAFGLRAIALRYFNAAGCDPAGDLGEAHDPETHLIPLAIDAGLGRGKPLTVFGRDFDTPDGSCVRDYVHVTDLAEAHVAALTATIDPGGFEALNVGAGRGCSVLEVIAEVERVLGVRALSLVGARRPGDPACLVADISRIRERLAWAPKRSSLANIVETAVAWRRSPAFGAVRSGAATPTPAAATAEPLARNGGP